MIKMIIRAREMALGQVLVVQEREPEFRSPGPIHVKPHSVVHICIIPVLLQWDGLQRQKDSPKLGQSPAWHIQRPIRNLAS